MPVRRIFLLTLTFAVLVGVIDLATGGNYMYLRQVPASGTLLSVMGPWPWYIVGAAVLAGAIFAVLELPFRIVGRERARSRISPYPPRA